MEGLSEFLKDMKPHRIPPPHGLILRLHPEVAGRMEQQGIDPDDYLRRLNESTRRRLQSDGDDLPVVEQWPG